MLTVLSVAVLGAPASTAAAPATGANAIDPLAELDRYNVVWDSPSRDAAGSMPIGNGEVGLNVWVEENGDLRFYISRTDTWSECNRLLKLGRVRLSLSPNPFVTGTPFRQALILRDGQIEITAGDATLRVFVDADAPVIHVIGRGQTPRTVTATLENWRTGKRVLKGEELASSWTMQAAPDGIEVWESPDVVAASPTAVTWYHRNEYSIVPLTLKHQGLESLAQLVRDPLLQRTFGGRMSGPGFVSEGSHTLKSAKPAKEFFLSIATHTAQTPDASIWQQAIVQPVDSTTAANRTAAWWQAFWHRSWILVEGDKPVSGIPNSKHRLRLGVDSTGASRFLGTLTGAVVKPEVMSAVEIAKLAAARPEVVAPWTDISLTNGFTVAVWIKPAPGESGRIFDKITAGGSDGFLLDTHPGLSLRLIVGPDEMAVRDCLKPGVWQHVAATVNASTGVRQLFLNGRLLKAEGGSNQGGSVVSSRVTQAYVLQRWMTACGGRGNYPIKFNGSIFTVDPKFAGGPDYNADWRRWGDCFWWQNTRLPYFPMIARGDFDELSVLFRFYREVLPLCEARAKLYHGATGAYFPETMTIFGTYANNDYGWNRQGHQPNEVLCPYWQYAWQQGLELTALMLDCYEHTRDAKFLNEELIPMAHSVLSYYDTRFQRDANGKLVISPTQAVETYWYGVTNDTPSVAGLHDVLDRLLLVEAPASEREFWQRMKAATPALPLRDGRVTMAEAFKPERSNVENPELFAIWPFRLYGVGRPGLELGRETFKHRTEKASIGWQYDGQCAGILGLTDDAKQILLGKIRNSHPNFRFPAMWGPNYDWLPDQDHGSNIMLTLQHMVLESTGDKIFLLPAWPADWNVKFKLHAPKNTTVEGAYRNGKLESLKVTPASRQKDVVLATGTN
ncbi:MAG: DUF5703 domain-containing protein [Verrucomicrobiota bacterium]